MSTMSQPCQHLCGEWAHVRKQASILQRAQGNSCLPFLMSLLHLRHHDITLVKDSNPKTSGSQTFYKPRTQEDYEFIDSLDYIKETLSQTNKQGMTRND